MKTSILETVTDCEIIYLRTNEPHHEKAGFLPMQKQRRRSASQLLHSYQLLCFHYTDSTISLLPKSEISNFFFWGCTGRFVSDLVGNPEDRFSRVTAQIFLHRSPEAWHLHL